MKKTKTSTQRRRERGEAQRKINGLFLWNVKIMSDNGEEDLLITTIDDSVKQAMNNTVAFLRKYKTYPNARLTGIKFEGVLDA